MVEDDGVFVLTRSEFLNWVFSGVVNEYDGSAHYEDSHGKFLGYADWTGHTEIPKGTTKVIWTPK